MFGLLNIAPLLLSIFLVVPFLLIFIDRKNRKRYNFSHFILNRIKIKKSKNFNYLLLIIRFLIILFLILFFSSLFIKKSGVIKRDDRVVLFIDNSYLSNIESINSSVKQLENFLKKYKIKYKKISLSKSGVDSNQQIGIYNKVAVGYSNRVKDILKEYKQNSRVIYLGGNYRYSGVADFFYYIKNIEPMLDTMFLREDSLKVVSKYQLKLYDNKGYQIDKLQKNSFFLQHEGEYLLKIGDIENFRFYIKDSKKSSVTIIGDDFSKIYLISSVLSPVFDVKQSTFSDIVNVNSDFAICLSKQAPTKSSVDLFYFPISNDSVEFFYLNKRFRPKSNFFNSLLDIKRYGDYVVDVGFDIKRVLNYRVIGAKNYWKYGGQNLAYKKGNITYFTFDIDTSNTNFILNPLFITQFSKYISSKNINYYVASDTIVTNLQGDIVKSEKVLNSFFVSGKLAVSNYYCSGYLKSQNDSVYVNNNIFRYYTTKINSNVKNIEIGSANELKKYLSFYDLKRVLIIIIILLFVLDSYLSLRRKW